MRKHVITAATAIMLGVAATTAGTIAFVASIGGAIAAETGTKTMPNRSVNPPPTPPPVFNFAVRHPNYHECYLPLGRCDNNHRVQN
jgi:hypothetical protein